MTGAALDILIPALVLLYAAWLTVRMLRRRRRGCGKGGCAGCPMADGCRMLHETQRKEDDFHE